MKKRFSIYMLTLIFTSGLSAQSYEAYLDSALLKSEQRHYTAAIDFCTKAIVIEEDSTRAYFYRAGLYVALISKRDAGADYKNYKAAIADYSKVLALDETHVEALFFRGGAHSDMGFLDQARTDYEASLAISDNLPAVHNSLAVIYARTGDPATAMKHIDKAIAQAPNYAKAYSNKGNIHDMMRQTAAACESWKKAIELGYSGGMASYNAKCK